MIHLRYLVRATNYILIVLALGSCSLPPKVPDTSVERPPVTRRESPKAEVPKAEPGKREAPKVAKVFKRYTILQHKYFEVHYDPNMRLARWVKYTLTREHLANKVGKRKDHFHADPMLAPLELTAVVPKDYAKTGYDKGHLAPSADFAFSQEANDDTFVMSNMTPQKPGLNRSAWRLLEEQVRKWACGEERVIVITGPILEGKLPTLKSGVPIPNQFFKIVIDDTPPRKALAFVYNQEDSGPVMKQREVSLAKLDERLQEDFETLVGVEQRLPAQEEPWKECVP